MHSIRTPDGVERLLGLVPSRTHCPVLLGAIPVSTGQVIPENQLVEYQDWPACLSVLDQGQWNACTYYASTQALMYGRCQSGQAHISLDPMWPYLAVTEGANVGTNLIEAGLRIARFGVPPVGTQQAMVATEAQRFRFELGKQFVDYEQILSEVARHRAVVGSVCVGPSWNHLDAEGVPGVTSGTANHAIFLGGGVRKSQRHGWIIQHVGSWGPAWGNNGFAWYTEAHFDASRHGEFYAVQGVHEDMSIDVPPPVAIA
jgi:hypothetical protein